MAEASPFAQTRAAPRAWRPTAGARQPVTVVAEPGETTGGVRALLRVEGLLVLAAASAAYAQTGSGWPLFAMLFLLPDLSMLGYLAGPQRGALVYNLGHSYVGPAVLAGMGWALAWPAVWPVALVWLAHIGFDRALGYGLKYTAGFRATHLGRLGERDPW